jgi:hypothetical protein
MRLVGPSWRAPGDLSAWPTSPHSRYSGVGALGATVSEGRAELTDHPNFKIFETNLLSARHADPIPIQRVGSPNRPVWNSCENRPKTSGSADRARCIGQRAGRRSLGQARWRGRRKWGKTACSPCCGSMGDVSTTETADDWRKRNSSRVVVFKMV